MNKGGVAVAAGVVVIGGTLVIVLSRQAKAAPPGEGEGEGEGEIPGGGKVSLKLELFDAAGNPVGNTIKSGETYKVKATVTNELTENGVLVPATLTLGMSAGTEYVTMIEPVEIPLSFGAGESLSISFDMVVPPEASGIGTICGYVDDYSGQTITSALITVTVERVAKPKFYMPPTLEVKEAGPVDEEYIITFSTRITNKGDAKGRFSLVWGSNELSSEYAEEASRIIEIEPGKSYDWSWSWPEIPYYYRGYFTVWLFGGWEGNNAAMGIWY